MSPIPITIASGDYDRVQAISTGQVGVKGCAVTYLNFAPGQTFRRLFNAHEFDVSEMSFSTYLLALSQGGFPYRAVPVFLSRVFPHCSIYIRDDRGIHGPEDLRGRAVGIPSYHFTRGLCVRGMLADEYAVQIEDISWRTGGIDLPGGLAYLPMTPPAGVEVDQIPPDKALGPMLAAGEIDAIITYRDPAVFTERAPHVVRLFPDFRPLEQAWYAKTGIFPIMHVLGIRESLLEAHPWIAASIVRAFEEAKALAMPKLVDLDALSVMLPWLVAEAEATMALMGDDFWPYGTEANMKTLEAQTRWSFEQGISTSRFQVDELFHPLSSE